MASVQPDGKGIRARRKRLKLSQEAVEDLSRMLPPPFESVSSRTLRAAERGARVEINKLRAIAHVLETTPESLIVPEREAEPFPGLRAYGFGDRALLGGRDAAIARGVLLLRERGTALVIGPSGSGKSSLCLAGIVPAWLDAAPGAALITLRPGEDALRALGTGLAETLSDGAPLTDAMATEQVFFETLTRDEGALGDILAAARRRGAATEFLLYVDQAEELCARSRDAPALLAQLDRVMDHPEDVPLRCLLSIRADYVGAFMALGSDFPRRLDESALLMRRMTGDELREALSRPVEAAGVPMEPSLIETLIRDTAEEPGYLPHAQFVLHRLWQSPLAPDKRLTVARYLHEGGIAGSISRHASRLYASLSADEKKTARAALPRLVALGGHRRDVAMRRALDDFGPAAQALLRRLAAPDARLIQIDEDGEAQFAHEEIIRQWPELIGWLEEDAADVRLLDQLDREIAQWKEHGERTDYLAPPGEKLRKFEALMARLPPEGVPSDAGRYLRASRRASSIWRRATAPLVAAAASLTAVGAYLAAEPLEAWWRARAADASLERIAALVAAKDAAYPRDRRMFFPDWPEKRLADYDEIAAAYARFYDYGTESAVVREALANCAVLEARDLSYLFLGNLPLEEYAARCGLNKISHGRMNFSLMTENRLPDGFRLLDTEVIGSAANRIDFGTADVEGTLFACSMIDGSDFSRVRNMSPHQIEDAFCLFPHRGPPVLPDGWTQPEGCRWVEDARAAHGWSDYAEARNPRSEAVRTDLARRMAAALDTHYYGCLDRERAYTLAEDAFAALLAGRDDDALRMAREALALEPAPYVRLKTLPVMALAGGGAIDQPASTALAREAHPRWGPFDAILRADLAALRQRGRDTAAIDRMIDTP